MISLSNFLSSAWMKEFDSDVNKSKVNEEKLNITDYELYPKEGWFMSKSKLEKSTTTPRQNGII